METVALQDLDGYLARLEQTYDEMVARIKGLTDEELTRKVNARRWSVKEVLLHLLDTELVLGYRLRRVVADDAPQLIPFEQDTWSARLRYNTWPTETALEAFRALRLANIALIRLIAPEAWQRVGHHSERGEVSFGSIVKMLADHSEHHVGQMDRVKAALGL